MSWIAVGFTEWAGVLLELPSRKLVVCEEFNSSPKESWEVWQYAAYGFEDRSGRWWVNTKPWRRAKKMDHLDGGMEAVLSEGSTSNKKLIVAGECLWSRLELLQVCSWNHPTTRSHFGHGHSGSTCGAPASPVRRFQRFPLVCTRAKYKLACTVTVGSEEMAQSNCEVLV